MPGRRDDAAANPLQLGGPERFSLPVLSIVTIAFGLLIYFPTFRLSYAVDDIDFLNGAADFLSGRAGLSSMFAPQNEHFLPSLRLLFSGYCHFFGTNFLFWRLFVFGSHVGSALFLAVLARKYFPSPGVAEATAVAYVLFGGLSSMWIWGPGLGSVPLGMLGITAGMAALAHGGTIGRRRARWLAAAGLVAAISFESGLVPMAATTALVDELERRRNGRPRSPVGLFFVFCALLAVGVAIAKFFGYFYLTGTRMGFSPLGAVSRTAFLLAVAPFRLFFPGLALPHPLEAVEWLPWISSTFGLVIFLVAAGILATVLITEAEPLLQAAVLSATGPIGWIILVGIGRSRTTTYDDLYSADRYFAPLLVPIALVAGVFVGSIVLRARGWSRTRRRLVATCVGAAFLTQLPLHAAAVRRRVPYHQYEAHRLRFEQFSALARILVEAAESQPASSPPLEIPDTGIYFPDVHNHRLSTRLLVYVSNRHRTPRLRLGAYRVGPRDEAILNPALERWATSIGERIPYLSVSGGELLDAHDTGAVRYFVNAGTKATLGGFHDWEGVSRWMGPRGELGLVASGNRLRLMLTAPVPEIRAWNPAWTSIPVTVSLRLSEDSAAERVGVIDLTDGTIQTHSLPIPARLAAQVDGHLVRIVLEVPRTWKPFDVFGDKRDARSLSVRVLEVAFEKDPPGR